MTDIHYFYQTLNIVGEEINDNTLIQENFKKLALSNHPDLIAGDKKIITERFFNICLAYLVLNNTGLKSIYNRQLNNEILDDAMLSYFDEQITKFSSNAENFTKLKFKEFIQLLRDDLKIISELNAQTSLGLYYDYLDFKEDQRSYEFFIDPEDIKPKISMLADVLLSFIKVIGITLLIYICFYITAYIRI